jgi:hypothetical protein
MVCLSGWIRTVFRKTFATSLFGDGVQFCSRLSTLSQVATIKPSPLDVRLEIASRYLGEEGGRAFVHGIESESMLFVIRADRWITADFSGEL